MSRMIDADALKACLVHDYAYAAASMVDDAPTIEAEPVRYGRWIDAREWCGDFMCSNCDALYGTNKFNYCPNCGAKMEVDNG